MKRLLPALVLVAIGCGAPREDVVARPAPVKAPVTPPAPPKPPPPAAPVKPAPPVVAVEKPAPAPPPALVATPPPPAPRKLFAGLIAPVGPVGPPTRVRSLMIDKPGVYENYLVDGEFATQDLVRIKANNVVLRNCEIRNGARDGIEVYASDVLIENCRIHHFLNGGFAPHLDAHGITGQPTRLTIRNCEISYVSGDAVQFDPGRKPWTDVVIENCVFFTGPLPEAAGGFKKGERPGENAVDTKQRVSNPRSRLTIRNTICHGWRQPAQIENMSALNLKNHLDVKVEECLFYDNEISLRLRGPQGDPEGVGGAWVKAENCLFYSSGVAVRLEDKIEKTRLVNPRYGADVKVRVTGGEKTGPGTRIDEGADAPSLETVLGRE